MSNLSFHIDLESLQTLLKNFYALTRIHIAVYDDSFHEVTRYPGKKSTFCRLLQTSDKAFEHCVRCTEEACLRSKQEKRVVTFRCHAGLLEVVTPIFYENAVIGYMMIGQLLQTDDLTSSWEQLEAYLATLDVDLAQLKAAYLKKQNITEPLLAAASNIMQACAGYLCLSKTIVPKEDQLSHQIDEYINRNLAEVLNTDTLCTLFRISKNRLYAISSLNYGKGIMQHITELRMERARHLLIESEKTVGEVADACGYTDYNYFTKVFKKHTGETPRDYRKNHKSTQAF